MLCSASVAGLKSCFIISTAIPTISEGIPDVQVVVFQSAEFECLATGIPVPEIYWRLGETRLMNTTETAIESSSDDSDTYSVLTIREVPQEYNGATVTCTAENVVDSASASAALTVLCKSMLSVRYITITEVAIPLLRSSQHHCSS